MRLHRARPVACVLLALHLSACTSWRPTTMEPAQLIEEENPDEVRLTLRGGERLALQDPQIRADSVSGRRPDLFPEVAAMSVAAADVLSIEVKYISVGRTVGLTVLIAAVSVGIGGLLCVLSNCGFDFSGR